MSFTVNYILIPFPETILENAAGNGMSSFMRRFLGLLNHLNREKNQKQANRLELNKTINLKAITVLIGTIFITPFAIAQDKDVKTHASDPIPIEVFFGNDRFVSQFNINKKISENSKFGFLASSFIAADYGNDKTKNESMNVALINYQVLKGFGFAAGAALNSQWGFRPYSGLIYLYGNTQFVAVVMPGFYLTESHNFQSIGFIEYRPRIKKQWSLFSRLEGLYNLDMDTKKHDRSHVYSRLGISYKAFSFGVAANYDWYGPFKDKRENFGLFLRNDFR